jgi:folate-dependent tRNA-U54 methylase TrmFO/GidA
VLGSLLHYLAHASAKDFGPTNAMLGLLPALPEGDLDIRGLKRVGGTRAVRTAKGDAHRKRALAALEAHLRAAGP